MSAKLGPTFKYLEQPIFALGVLNDYVIIASGGGGKKYGVRNKILSYKIIEDKGFSEEPSHVVEFAQEIPVYIHTNEKTNYFCTCIDNLTVLYELNIQSGQFNEIFRLRVLEYFDLDVYLNLAKFDISGNYLGVGTTDGALK